MKRKAFCRATVLLIILILATIWNGPGGIPVAQAYDEPLVLNLGLQVFSMVHRPPAPGSISPSTSSIILHRSWPIGMARKPCPHLPGRR